MQAVEVKDLTKIYASGSTQHFALNEVSVSVDEGQFLVVRGRSGSGKSTLLHCIAGLRTPTSGSVLLRGNAIHGMSTTKAAEFRRRNVGIVYQFFNLVSTLNVEYNVALPLLLDGHRIAKIRPRTVELLGQLEIAHLIDRPVQDLSGGEMQRVAIARALVADPMLVLADEPTGNLDSDTAGHVLDALRMLNQEYGVTVIMVTHDPSASIHADRVLTMRDGRLGHEL